MAERRAAAKGRRMGSSRRKQLRQGSGEAPAAAPGPGEEPSWASETVQRMEDFFRERDQAGFITRSDMQKLQEEEDFPCSTEELELVFDGLDAAGTGRLSTKEFTAELGQFLSSQKAVRDHRRRKTASRRVRLVLPSPALEGVDSEEQRHFAAFMDQLGTDNISSEQEIWQLWVKLRQDEPQLLGNLEDFLAKMRHRIQEARSKKAALEVTLNKRVAEHDKEVQQLCEALEQQIQQEQQRLQQESMARSHQHDVELQQALDASEKEVQRLVMAQMELETRCRSLRSTQQATSTENRQLQESNRVLEDHLQHLHQQLQQTQGRLRTMRATVAWEHMEEPRHRAVAELPGQMPLSPQTSPEKSEKHRSEMRIRLGSRSTEPKTKSTHQVVWEVLPAEITVLGASPRASSTEEDPFPESLKEERFSDQSSLLREMNDAIAALSKHLKTQAPGAPSVPADAAHHPRDNAEHQMGLEAAAAHGTTPGVLRETLPGHVGHELSEGDLKEGTATAELHAPDMMQAGASAGAGHHRAWEPGAEQGESPEEARRMLFLQGKDTGVAEHLQGAPGESTEAGEQVEGEGWMQERPGWEKAQLLGEAEEAALKQGENPEADLGPPEAGEAGPAAGRQLGPAVPPEERAQPRGAGLGEEADPPSGLSKELEIKPGEHLEPEPPSWGETRMAAAWGDGVLPKVTVAPDPGMLEEEHVRAEMQPCGEDALPAQAQHGGSRGAGVEEGEVEVTPRGEAEPQEQGECARAVAACGGSVGTELPATVPPSSVWEGGAGPDVQPLEAQSSDAAAQWLAEVEVALQPPREAGSPGTEQGGSVAPDVQPLEEEDRPGLGLGEENGAAMVQGEGPSPAETPVGSPHLGGPFPVKAQALELVGTEGFQADTQLHGDPSPEVPQGRGDHAAMQLRDEGEDGGRGQGEHELSHEPLMDLHGAGFGQGEGAGEEEWAGPEADEGSVGSGDPAPLPVVLFGVQGPGAEVDGGVWHLEKEEELVQGEGINENGLFPVKAQALELVEAEDSWSAIQLRGGPSPEPSQGGSTEADLQSLSQAGSLDTEQGGSVSPDVQPLDHVDKPELVETVGAEDLQADTQLRGGVSPETLQGWGHRAAVHLMEEAEDGEQEQDEPVLLHEPVLDPHGVITRQGEGAGAGVQPWEEEVVILDTVKDQSTEANVQLIAEVDKLKLIPAGSTEAGPQPLMEAGSLDTEQGWSVSPDVQPLDQVDKPELVEMVGAEDSWVDMQMSEGASPETLQGWGDRAAVNFMEEAEDVEEGQDEPVPDPHGMITRQGEGAGAGVQPWEEAGSLGMLEDQSTDANVQLFAERDALELIPGGSTEAGPQPSREVDSLDTEQGWSVSPDVQPLDQVDKPKVVEMEAENLQADLQLHGVLSPEAPRGEESGAAMQLMEEAEDGGQVQDEHGLPHQPGLDPQGAGVRQGEGAGAGVQPWEEVVTLGTLEDQSTDANMQLLAEAAELKLTLGGSRETDLQSLSQAGSLDTEQGGSVSPDVQPLDHVDKPELVETVGAEDLQADTQLRGGVSPETLQGWGHRAAIHLMEEAEDGEQEQDEPVLLHEPVLDPHGVITRQGEGAGAGVQPWEEEVMILDTVKDQSTEANVQLIAEVDKLKLIPAGSTEADLQSLSQAGSLDTEQGGSVSPAVQPLDQVDKPELVEMVGAEDSWVDMQMSEGASPETLQGWGDRAAVSFMEEAEDAEQGQDEPVPDPHGMITRQGEGAGAGVQPWEEAGGLGTLEDQSTDANVQLFAERDELKLIPGGSTEAGPQPSREVDSLDTEQGWSVSPDVQPLDQVDKPKVVEMEAENLQADLQLHGVLSPEAPRGGESGAASWAEDSWVDMQLRAGPSPETLQGWGDHTAVPLVEEAEVGAQEQDAHELPHELVLDLQGAGVGEGEEGPEGVQPWEEAESLDTLEDQGTDANVHLLTQAEELKASWGGSTEASWAPPGAAGMREGEQSQALGLEAGLCAAHTAEVWEGAAGAHVSLLAEATSHPSCAAATAGPGLEAKPGGLTGPDGQILEDTQALEILQGGRADAEQRPLDGAQGLEVVWGGRLEAGVRGLVETQGLGLKQGHGEGASVLASPVSEVPLEISTLKLETMMQEDVLIPDVQRLGASGQAAQRKLQEQVSAQADKVRLHTASQQLEEKPPHVMETEQVAARPAEPLKQEVPPASNLHTKVQQEEDAGNNQLGMVHGDSSLGDAANSSMQPQRQLLGEQSKDLNVGQQEKQQEAGWKTSQEDKPSPGQPGAMTAGGAGAAPGGRPEASLDPDHLYNVLFVGDSHVGKTSFLYRLHADTFNPHLTATVGLDYQVKNLVVDNKRFALRLWDSAGQERYRSITKQFFRKADGVVLMYDVTSEHSFSDVRYWLSCIQEGAEDGVAILLLGNKTDCAAERRVPTKEGERLAKEHQLMFYECSAASGHNVTESMVSFIRLLKVQEDELKNKAEEVPNPPQKKKSCCW